MEYPAVIWSQRIALVPPILSSIEILYIAWSNKTSNAEITAALDKSGHLDKINHAFYYSDLQVSTKNSVNYSYHWKTSW